MGFEIMGMEIAQQPLGLLVGRMAYVFAGAFTLVLWGCGGGGSSSEPPPPAATAAENSYSNYKAIGLLPQTLPSGDNTVRAYGNFFGDGSLGYFRAVLTYSVNNSPSDATPSRFEFYERQSDGSFILNTEILPNADGCIHPRKAVVADFNADGRPDIFVACHGYDAHPFPGERNKVVLSLPGGGYAVSDASEDVGFFHAATAADLNNDGLPDVVVVDNKDPMRAYVLLNDGTGHFTRESMSRLSSMVQGGNYFTVELIDVNEDGRLDLLIGGHEWEDAPTRVFINPGDNNFSAVTPLVVPPIPNEGVVLDFTVTGTGISRSIWILRTSGGDGTFYQSRVVQKVSFPSLSSTVVLNERPAHWVPWLIPAVVGGQSVVTSDNAADDIIVLQ
ncbi:MAG: FG-GAP repeat domain-containing protein [Caldimonas sp.]|uniref:FG-GAP repeat domain-containing protein n=1 Tax=Caldimonas sp. TaxID=2838790 RepID=UPI0039195694